MQYEAQLVVGLRVEFEFSSENVTNNHNVKKMTHFNDAKCFCSFQKMGLISASKSIPGVTRKLRCSSSDGNVLGTNGSPLVRETILKEKSQ